MLCLRARVGVVHGLEPFRSTDPAGSIEPVQAIVRQAIPPSSGRRGVASERSILIHLSYTMGRFAIGKAEFFPPTAVVLTQVNRKAPTALHKASPNDHRAFE